MSRKRIVFTRVDDGGLSVTAPAYFDRVARRLKDSNSSIKHTAAGWVLTTSAGILREADGELVASDADVTTPDGLTVFALDQSAFEQWVIARNQAVGVIPAGIEGEAYRIIDVTDLPNDRYFRDSWEWSD